MATRLLMTRREAAAALGMSLSHFQRHVQPELRCVRSGQLRLFRPSDLERWLENAVADPNRRHPDEKRRSEKKALGASLR